jgi:cholest-4-en-3-one 26-monooxygenase
MASLRDDVELDELDITTTARYVEHGFPWREWDVLRERAPVYRYERPGVPACWVVTRYDDIKTVHRLPGIFSNAGPILRLDSTDRLQRLARFKERQAERWAWDPDEPLDMVYLDRPEHLDFRMLTLRGFSRASMRRLEEDLAALSRRHRRSRVDAVRRGSPGDDLPVDRRANVGLDGRLEMDRRAGVPRRRRAVRDTW